MHENGTYRARFWIHALCQKAFGKVRPLTAPSGRPAGRGLFEEGGYETRHKLEKL
jgi:hypothetical protein